VSLSSRLDYLSDMACARISRIVGKMVRTMMPINEAITILKKIRDCNMCICSDTLNCSKCQNFVGQIMRISTLETAVDFIERTERTDGKTT